MTSIADAISIARTRRKVRLRIIWAVCLTAASVLPVRAANEASVTAAQVNGTWATPAGEFKIWALDDHHLRVEFSVAAEHKEEAGPTANAGDGHGIATIQGNTAIFRPDDTDTDCRITLKFKRHDLVVTQTTRFDFGKYANVNGSYKKVSTSKPVFRFGL
jgi:hypothetical protein